MRLCRAGGSPKKLPRRDSPFARGPGRFRRKWQRRTRRAWPTLGQQARERNHVREMLPRGCSPPESTTFRQGWETYIRGVWPRSTKQVVSCIMARGARGRGGDDDVERDRTKGPAVACEHAVSDARGAVAPSNDVGGENNSAAEQVLRTARRAVAPAKPPATQGADAAKSSGFASGASRYRPERRTTRTLASTRCHRGPPRSL